MTTSYKNVDVEIDIDLNDVTDFISEATKSELESITEALASKGLNVAFLHLDSATVAHLVNRANQFGIQDMLLELKQAGEKIGSYLNLKAVNHE
ncbi:hypothetical protein RFY44_10100 [Acinetobacter bereziniae]|uniref:hypothetical protein n=1 Tax=Acinetobacter bereziniae TaxID=106648 RepID=UPI0028140376|nr:hypothetical protein [Acinetobacter bereziniae]MDQ9819234.1 hypothetical protein [Acinetobacter bereziniae]